VVEEQFFHIFYLPLRRKNVPFTYFIFRRGGRTILLRFLSSATAEERPFLVFLSSPVEEEHSFSIGSIELTFF